MITLCFAFFLAFFQLENIPDHVVSSLIRYNEQRNTMRELESFGISKNESAIVEPVLKKKTRTSSLTEIGSIGKTIFVSIIDSSRFILHSPDQYVSTPYLILDNGLYYEFKCLVREQDYIEYVNDELMSPDIKITEFDQIVEIYFKIYCKYFIVLNKDTRSIFPEKLIRDYRLDSVNPIINTSEKKTYWKTYLVLTDNAERTYEFYTFMFNWRQFKIEKKVIN